MLKKIPCLFWIFVFMLTACAGGDVGLQGTTWELVKMGDALPVAGTTVTIMFEDGTASGSAGCNSYSGGYSLDGDSLAFGEIASTLMACMEPGVMEQESAYLVFLQQATSHAILDGFLYIYRDDGSVLQFKPQ
jgi:heat shock protein HslJ